jgi:hypothetical protein
MQNLIYFSDYFKPIAGKLRFAFIVVGRFIKILFKRRKRIELLQLEYSRKYLFDNSYLIIKYRFKNALWYKFKKLKITTEKHAAVFNLKNINSTDIALTVYGFFQKKVYHISVMPENILVSQRFITAISGINKETAFMPSLKPNVSKPIVVISQIQLKKTYIQVTQSPYIQTDFI